MTYSIDLVDICNEKRRRDKHRTPFTPSRTEDSTG